MKKIWLVLLVVFAFGTLCAALVYGYDKGRFRENVVYSSEESLVNSQVKYEDYSGEFVEKIKQIDINKNGLEDIIKVMGEPDKYVWGSKSFEKNNLPNCYIMIYPRDFHIFMNDNKIVELRYYNSNYILNGNIQVGVSLDEVLKAVGSPDETIEGKSNGFKEGVLYKDIDGKKGYCYYDRYDKGVRMFFTNYKITALYQTSNHYNINKVGQVDTSNMRRKKTDNIDLPFVDDPDVLGTWESVDFVKDIDQFKVGKTNWEGDLFLEKLVFFKNGELKFNDDTPRPWFAWTKGVVTHAGDKTASKYIIKQIQGETYMFFEWKSGDYIYRNMKPYYYVLKKTK